MPSKRDYVLDKDKDKKCLFCRVVNGEEIKDVRVLYKNDKMLIVLNRYPYNPGHLMVIPTRHVENLTELTNEEISYLFNKVRDCINLLNEEYTPPGFNVGINIGQYSGASIRHLHIHVLPRFKNELGFMETVNSTRILVETLDQTLERLKKKIDLIKD
ncbi:MAG: HIT family protein [Candidatus Odinarchaeia archaeon]